jgi:hypothetical protein
MALVHAGARRGDDMPGIPLTIAEIDERIAALRENLRELVEQAAAYSGASDEDLASRRIAEQEEELELLARQRDKLARSGS